MFERQRTRTITQNKIFYNTTELKHENYTVISI